MNLLPFGHNSNIPFTEFLLLMHEGLRMDVFASGKMLNLGKEIGPPRCTNIKFRIELDVSPYLSWHRVEVGTTKTRGKMTIPLISTKQTTERKF